MAQGVMFMEKSLPHIGSVNFDTLDRLVGKIMQGLGVTDPNEVISMIMNGEVKMTINSKLIEKEPTVCFWLTVDDATAKQQFREINVYKEMSNFEPTKTYYKVAIKNYRHEMTVENILAEAESEGLVQFSVEIASMVHKRVSYPDMRIHNFNSYVLFHGKNLDGSIHSSCITKMTNSDDLLIFSMDYGTDEVFSSGTGFVFIEDVVVK